MSGAAAVIIIKQNRWMRQCEALGAISPDSAVVAQDIKNTDSWLFKRMVSKGVFILTGDGKLYMDQSAAKQFCTTRRIKMIMGLLLGVIVVMILVLTK
jgi:hypothetical protein